LALHDSNAVPCNEHSVSNMEDAAKNDG
jgi:hypothetical protein